MSVSSAPEPPNVYLACGSICGKTLVSEAAARTVGRSPPAAEVDAAPAVPVADPLEVVLLPLPQPTTAAALAMAVTVAHARRPGVALNTATLLIEHCARILAAYRDHGIDRHLVATA